MPHPNRVGGWYRQDVGLGLQHGPPAAFDLLGAGTETVEGHSNLFMDLLLGPQACIRGHVLPDPVPGGFRGEGDFVGYFVL